MRIQHVKIFFLAVIVISLFKYILLPYPYFSATAISAYRCTLSHIGDTRNLSISDT